MSNKLQLQRLNRILNLAVIFPIIYVLMYLFLKDTESIRSFTTEFIAGVLGVIIGFSLEQRNRLKNEIDLSEKIVNNLINEIQINKNILNDVNRISNDTKKGYYFQLQTTVWDMHKQSLIFDEMDTYFEVAKLYHSFIELNGSINNSGNILDATKMMGEYGSKLFFDILKQIDIVLGFLEQT